MASNCSGNISERLRINMESLQVLPARHMLCGQQYCIESVLGSGGFGITYRAWDRRHNRKVAVKEFFPRHLAVRSPGSAALRVHPGQAAEFSHARLRFQQEAEALYELRNVPEVINVLRLFEENGTAYYVMELLSGQDMKGYLAANGVMTWNVLQGAVAMILRALDAVHGRQLIHRDISPDNLFLLQGGGAKLIDFGNARSYMSASPLTKILKTRFAPVEQFMDDGRQGPWTDIYSLSVTLYYALSGVLPPPASDRMIAVRTGGGDPARPLGQIRPDIPGHVAGAVSKGMEVMVADRYQTVGELARQLFPGMDILGGRPENPPPHTSQPGAGPVSPSQRIPQPGTGAVSPSQRIPQTGQQPVSVLIVQCTQGMLQGRRLTLRPGVTENLGRGKDVSVMYPADSQGISRHQCSFMQDNRRNIYVRDDGSSYGTRLNGRQMKPMEWYPVKKGDRVCFAKEEYKILG